MTINDMFVGVVSFLLWGGLGARPGPGHLSWDPKFILGGINYDTQTDRI